MAIFTWNKRYGAYAGILVLLAALAVWVWYEPGYLKELKKMEPVTAGLEEACAVMDELLEAMASKDRNKLMSLMLIKDGTEYQRLFGALLESSDFLPLEVKATGKLTHSHKKDNISFFCQSSKSRKNNQFGFVKDGAGKYKLRSISSFKALPGGLEATR